MRTNITVLNITIAISMLLFSCNNKNQTTIKEKEKSAPIVEAVKEEIVKAPKNDLGKIPDIAWSSSKKINALIDEQSKCTDIEKMFAYDSIIASAKLKANTRISQVFNSFKKPVLIYFSQTKNLDSIKIKNVKILKANYDILQLEATVAVVSNSVFDMPFTSITVYDSLGKRLDISGGIGLENIRLRAGKTYTFKGQMNNVSKLKPGFKFVFDEEIKKW